MSMINPDGFKVFRTITNNVLVEDNRINEYVEYINKIKIKYVTISLFQGFKGKDIEFLRKCPNIEYLEILTPLIVDYSPIYDLKDLKWLRIEDQNKSIDLAQLSHLEELHLDPHKHILNLDKCIGLKKIKTHYYNPPTRNLEEVQTLINLISLNIYKSNIDSFKGLAKLKKLEHLIFHNLSNLHFIDELEKLSDSLRVLVFEGCKKIENHRYVENLKKLKVLKFDNCSSIPNLQFIKQMPNLKAFVFVDTDIEDGDLAPCKGLE